MTSSDNDDNNKPPVKPIDNPPHAEDSNPAADKLMRDVIEKGYNEAYKIEGDSITERNNNFTNTLKNYAFFHLNFDRIPPDGSVWFELDRYPYSMPYMQQMRKEFNNQLREAVAEAARVFYICRDAVRAGLNSPDSTSALQYINEQIAKNGSKYKNIYDSYKNNINVFVNVSVNNAKYTKLSKVYASKYYNSGEVFIVDVSIVAVQAPKSVPTWLEVENDDEGNNMIKPSEYNKGKHGRILRSMVEDTQTVYVEEMNIDYAKQKDPRRMPMRIYGKDVMQFQMGSILRVMVILKAEDPNPNKPEADLDLYLQLVAHDYLQDVKEEEIELEDLMVFKKELDKGSAYDFLHGLTQSFCKHIYDNHYPKLLCLMVAVGATAIGDYRHQIHGYLIGSPGTGKSELIKAISELRYKGTYIDGPAASSRGLMYAQDEFASNKILRAGAMLTHEMVCLDELDKMNAADRREINMVLEQQKASYSKASFKVSTNTNISLLAAGNPKNGRWTDSMSIMDNLMPVMPDLISRMTVIRVEKPVSIEKQLDHIFDNILKGPRSEVKYSPEQIAGYITHVRKMQPTISPDTVIYIKDFLQKFSTIDQNGMADLPIESRQYMEVVRLSTAIAKLLMRSHVDAECADLAVAFYKECLKSLGVNTSEDAMVQMPLETNRQNKNVLLHELINDLIEKSDDNLLDHRALIHNMVQSTKWKSEEHAEKDWEQVREGKFVYVADADKYRKI